MGKDFGGQNLKKCQTNKGKTGGIKRRNVTGNEIPPEAGSFQARRKCPPARFRACTRRNILSKHARPVLCGGHISTACTRRRGAASPHTNGVYQTSLNSRRGQDVSLQTPLLPPTWGDTLRIGCFHRIRHLCLRRLIVGRIVPTVGAIGGIPVFLLKLQSNLKKKQDVNERLKNSVARHCSFAAGAVEPKHVDHHPENAPSRTRSNRTDWRAPFSYFHYVLFCIKLLDGLEEMRADKWTLQCFSTL